LSEPAQVERFGVDVFISRDCVLRLKEEEFALVGLRAVREIADGLPFHWFTNTSYSTITSIRWHGRTSWVFLIFVTPLVALERSASRTFSSGVLIDVTRGLRQYAFDCQRGWERIS